MKKIAKYTTLLLVIATTFFACDDFIEEDIENEVINLLAPKNNLLTIQPTHTFWWDFINGAEVYNMQMVEGSFTSVTYLVLDTTIKNNKFDMTLYPGSFQWRVRGENNGGVTDYTTFSFRIDSSQDISSIPIQLNMPINNEKTNIDSVNFSWGSLMSADVYFIEIENITTGAIVLSPTQTLLPNFSKRLDEGTYTWGVSGRNQLTGTSTALATRTLTVDITNPNIAILNSPAHNDLLADTLNTYTWTQQPNVGAGTPTVLTDKIYFYSDSGLTAPILIVPIPSGITQYTGSIGGDHFWKVETEDEAGNVAVMTTLRKVIIQP